MQTVNSRDTDFPEFEQMHGKNFSTIKSSLADFCSFSFLSRRVKEERGRERERERERERKCAQTEADVCLLPHGRPDGQEM